MLLIADSGSTKTDWRFFDKNLNLHDISTIGMNPYFVNKKDIIDVLEKDLYPYFDKNQIKEVYFYGSGCTLQDKILEVEGALKDFFTKAEVVIESDLLGTARAVSGDEPGIIGILGTGSNSCFYDGKNITSQLFSLGYILGDEGSGAVLGRKILKAALSDNMPEVLFNDFKATYPETPDSMLNNIYSKPFPNRFLASFAPFAIRHKNNEWMRDLLTIHVKEFFESMVAIYPDYQKYPLCLSGSIAYHLRDIVEDICEIHKMQLGNIIRRPIDGLAEYHLQRRS